MRGVRAVGFEIGVRSASVDQLSFRVVTGVPIQTLKLRYRHRNRQLRVNLNMYRAGVDLILDYAAAEVGLTACDSSAEAAQKACVAAAGVALTVCSAAANPRVRTEALQCLRGLVRRSASNKEQKTVSGAVLQR